MRLIDADYILEALDSFRDTEHGNRDFLLGIASAKEIIENAPTVPTSGEMNFMQPVLKSC